MSIHAAGVIDADYRGNVGVVLFNLSQQPYEGIWSVLCTSLHVAPWQQLNVMTELPSWCWRRSPHL